MSGEADGVIVAGLRCAERCAELHAGVRQLVEALRSEWESNHYERCTNVEHKPGDTCYHPKPDALAEWEQA